MKEPILVGGMSRMPALQEMDFTLSKEDPLPSSPYLIERVASR